MRRKFPRAHTHTNKWHWRAWELARKRKWGGNLAVGRWKYIHAIQWDWFSLRFFFFFLLHPFNFIYSRRVHFSGERKKRWTILCRQMSEFSSPLVTSESGENVWEKEKTVFHSWHQCVHYTTTNVNHNTQTTKIAQSPGHHGTSGRLNSSGHKRNCKQLFWEPEVLGLYRLYIDR